MRNVLWYTAIGALIAAFFCFMMGYHNTTLTSLGKAEPQTLTAAKLSAEGPGDNIHVKLTDFAIGENFVYEEKYGSWNVVWIPAFERTEQQGGDNLRIIVKSFDIQNKTELEQFCSQAEQKNELTGVITNSIHRLNHEAFEKLRASYPGAQQDRLYVIHEGMQFPDRQTGILLWSGGAAALVVAAICGFLLLPSREKAPDSSFPEGGNMWRS
jgi:hypothetical protein